MNFLAHASDKYKSRVIYCSYSTLTQLPTYLKMLMSCHMQMSLVPSRLYISLMLPNRQQYRTLVNDLHNNGVARNLREGVCNCVLF